MEEKKEETVVVNGQEIPVEEFERMKENQDKNTQIIENSEGNFTQRLND